MWGEYDMTTRAWGCFGLVKCGSRLVGLLALASTGPAFGLGLGEMRVQSGLGEPLVAEIELSTASAIELSTLEVTLGAEDVFNNAGVIRHQFLTQLEFEVIESTPPVIRVTSVQPISEPFLHIIIRTRWEFGMLLSEYTALLDPPLYAQQQPGSISTPVVLEEPDTGQAVEPASIPQAEVSGMPAGSFQYGPVAPGDNLWGIASLVDTAGLDANIFQVMIALLRQNPDAFIDNNINQLKSGETLTLEDYQSILLISKAEAGRSYKAQIERWQGAGPSTVIAARPDAAPPRSGLVQAQAEAPAETATPEVVEVEPSMEQGAAGAADQDAADMQAKAQPTDPDKYVFKITPPASDAAGDASEVAGEVDMEVAAMRAAIDREIAALRQQVVKLENEQRVSKALSTKEGDIESIKAEAEKEITTLREQIGFLKQAGADQEILALRGQLAALRRQETMTKEASSASAALAEAEQEIRELRAQVAALAKSDSAEAVPGQKDFSDLSDQVDVSQSPAVAATASPNVKVEIDSIRAGANQQITAMREQMEAMRAEMGQLLAAQKLRDAQNTELEKRIASLAGMLEGRVESSTLASLTASGNGSSSAQTKSRAAAGSDSDGKSVWEKWFDKLPEDDESRIALAAGILLILLLLWLLIRRHRALMRMEQSILMASGNMDEAASQLSEFKSKKPRYLSDLSIAGMGRMEAAEVDPLAEAEVYLAYGRAAQALEVLKEASSRNPDREELKLKLLEVYQHQGDVDSFDDLVAEMDLREEDMDQATWSKVVELKLKMQEKTPSQTPELDEQNDSQESESTPSESTPSESTPSESADRELPLDESIEKQNSQEKISASELPRDVLAKASVPVDPALRPFPEPDENARVGEEVLGTLGRADESGSGSRSETIPPGASSDDSDMMNFATSESSELDFDLESDLEKPLDPESDSAAPAAADESKQTFTLESSDTEEEGGDLNEVLIKTELAEAYMNMGDRDEALRILREIVEVANPDEKMQINELMKRANQ